MGRLFSPLYYWKSLILKIGAPARSQSGNYLMAIIYESIP